MNLFKKSLNSGKINKGDKRQQWYINISVLLGFVLAFIWTSIFKKTFIDVKIVLALVLIPSFIVYLFLFKKYVTICGYLHFIKMQTSYNLLIRFLVFLLIAMPVGNFIAFTFFFSNQLFSNQETQIIKLQPQNIYESKLKGKRYISFEITLDGTTKRLRSFEKSIDEIQESQLEFEVREGYFGYRFYEKYKTKKAEKNW